MSTLDAMLNAHVRFEVDRWCGDGLRATLADEVAAAYGWLEKVPLGDLLPREALDAAVRNALVEFPIVDGLVAVVEEAVKSIHATLLAGDASLGDLLDRRQYDQLTEAIVGMKPLRRELTRQVVQSSVYAMLVSNVLYNGIKGFVLTENVFARRIPGASSLVRFGQSALSSAAPNLEKGVDKQLVAFIRANIKDTLNESERYLNSVLDDAMIWQLADELWQSNAQRTAAEFAGMVDAALLVDIVDFARSAALHFRTTPAFDTILARLLDGFMESHAAEPVAQLLREIGMDEAQVVDALWSVAQPIAAKAHADGYLEARIRARLEPFYRVYERT